jgi:hypothetical protein
MTTRDDSRAADLQLRLCAMEHVRNDLLRKIAARDEEIRKLDARVASYDGCLETVQRCVQFQACLDDEADKMSPGIQCDAAMLRRQIADGLRRILTGGGK